MKNMFQNRKEMEEKMRQEGRLPPGQALTERFPVLHYGPIPPFDESSWDFRIWGEVERAAEIQLGGIFQTTAQGDDL